MKSIDEIVAEVYNKSVNAKEGWNADNVADAIRLGQLELLQEIEDNRMVYFYTKMGTEDIGIEHDAIETLQESIKNG